MFFFIIFLLTSLTFIYAGKILFFYFGLFKLKQGNNRQLLPVTILVPSRNEAANIRQCLNSLIDQTYPRNKIEIIVIDDDSQDRTSEIVREFFDRENRILLIRLNPCPPGISPKKRALQAGIDAAKNEIIFSIDADCLAPPDWVMTMLLQFEENVGLVAGYVVYEQQDATLFQKILTLEFVGLTTAGLGSIGAGDPIICNGANLAFRKRAFFDSGGYEPNKHVASGDDDLLMQTMHKKTAWKIAAAAESASIVTTAAPRTFNEFMNQRIRWASKGLVYRKLSLVGFLLSVYLFYLLLFISVPFALLFPLHFPYPLCALGIKFAVDFLLIAKGTALLNRKALRRYFLLAELFQIPYILYVGFAGVLGAFEWKSR